MYSHRAMVFLTWAIPLWSATHTAQIYLAAHDKTVEMLQVPALINAFARIGTAQDASLLAASIESARKSVSDKGAKSFLFQLEGQARALNGFLDAGHRAKRKIDMLYLLDALSKVNDILKTEIESYIGFIMAQGPTVEKYMVTPMLDKQVLERQKFWKDFSDSFVKHIHATYGNVAEQKNWIASDLASYWHYLTFVGDIYPGIKKPVDSIGASFRWVSGRLTLLGLIKGTNYIATVAPSQLFEKLGAQLTKTGTREGFEKQLAMLQAISFDKIKSEMRPEVQSFTTQVQDLVKFIQGDKSITQKDIAGIIPYLIASDARKIVASMAA